MASTLDNLPAELQYLKLPARKYGIYQFDSEIDELLSSIGDSELQELRKLGAKVKKQEDYELVLQWLNSNDDEETVCLYFLFCVLDAADVTFD